MSLNLMYITNRPDVAQVAQNSGVDRIFIDFEYIGKEERQAGLNTVKKFHTVEDVKTVRQVLDKSELLVRVNPIHEASKDWCDSKEEIDQVVSAGADVIMLPMAKTPCEIEKFVEYVGGRAKTLFLLETAEANENVKSMLDVGGIDQVHIGLNDLHLAYNKKFMFELLCDGTVERLCDIIKGYDIPFGIGGIAKLGGGLLPAEYIIAEHYRLGSTAAILSRSFCNAGAIEDLQEIENIFKFKLKEIRDFEESLIQKSADYFDKNKDELCHIVENIVRRKRYG
jgi:hypothetical protein